ncbi:MAG: chorismate mutase [Bacteroidales bacterium]|nr:chorismate mutase [Bacteroidales bacterium]
MNAKVNIIIVKICKNFNKTTIFNIAKELSEKDCMHYCYTDILDKRNAVLKNLLDAKEKYVIKIITDVSKSKDVKKIKSLNIDAVFIDINNINSTLINSLQSTGLKIFIKVTITSKSKNWEQNISNLVTKNVNFEAVFIDVKKSSALLLDKISKLQNRFPQIKIILGYEDLSLDILAKECDIENQLPNIIDEKKDILSELRSQIDSTDLEMLDIISNRMKIIKELGALKEEHNIPTIQKDRWDNLIKSRLKYAKELGLNEEVIFKIFDLLHKEAIRIQLKDLKKNK